MSAANATQPTVSDLVRAIRLTGGGMRTTESLAHALGIPETQIAALTAQARALGLITTERDPRTLSPMHRLTEAGRSHGQAAPRSTGRHVPAHRLAAQLNAILSPEYLTYLGTPGARRPHIPA